mmetsp:Transcript_12980/g.27308  ORF Transcript_12980/g.27308 Transcript_12980/m.27308 type:complete len:949 (+) Transcript_12980:96-2942(+)
MQANMSMLTSFPSPFFRRRVGGNIRSSKPFTSLLCHHHHHHDVSIRGLSPSSSSDYLPLRRLVSLRGSVLCQISIAPHRDETPISWRRLSFLSAGTSSVVISKRGLSTTFATKEEESNINSCNGKSSTSKRPSKIQEDGFTLSHFIAKSSASNSVHHISQTNSNDYDSESGFDSSNRNKNMHYSSSTPAAAELGDEFDDNDATSDEDLMITDAMSCNTQSFAKNSSKHSNGLNRLRHQMISSDEATIDENDSFHTMKFHIKTYGCQMNVNDTDIVRSILLNHHEHASHESSKGGESAKTVGNIPLKFIETQDEIQADILLTNTCAIRDNAEQKVWHRLRALRSHDRNFPLEGLADMRDCSGEEYGDDATETIHDRKRLLKLSKELRKQQQNQNQQPWKERKKRIIGVLGCMAERLKEDMFQDGTADLVVGPDAYRDLPRLISVLSAPSVAPSLVSSDNSVDCVDSGDEKNAAVRGSAKVTPTIPTERAVNVQLSLDETYASIAPVRANKEDVSAFVSIMRGCNNMCSYCVVPFTRGRERSRDMESVVEETRRLLEEEDIKEVILLGQNVNSYHDTSGVKRKRKGLKDNNDVEIDSDSSQKGTNQSDNSGYETSNPGFQNMFRLRDGDGRRFVDLLDAVSQLSPELRVRFTSPHPKDYPPPLLSLMSERPNICNHLHMPAQSGSSSVLERMRRGYTREAYLELIHDVKRLIPDVAISSDFISGFCGETEDEHRDTLSLMEEVQFDQAFMFAYSMRERTHAHRTMEDDVPADVKNVRLNEVISTFRREVQKRNDEVEVGKFRLVLVEGEAKRSSVDNKMWSGRTDQNKRVVFPDGAGAFFTGEEVNSMLSSMLNSGTLVGDQRPETMMLEQLVSEGDFLNAKVGLSRGDYAVVQILEARGHTLKGRALFRSSISGFEQLMNMQEWRGLSKSPHSALSDLSDAVLTKRLIL